MDWWCAEKVRNIAKNRGYGVIEFNEVDSPHLLGPCLYNQFFIATSIIIDAVI